MKLDAIDWTLGALTLLAVLVAVAAMSIIQVDVKPRACTLTELIQRTSLP